MVDSTLYQLLILFLLFYLFLIRPEMKKAKKHQEMLNALKKGDKIVTRGGLYATIVKIENENDLLAEIADGITVALSKGGVLSLADADNTVAAPSTTAAKEKTKTKAKAQTATKTKTSAKKTQK